MAPTDRRDGDRKQNPRMAFLGFAAGGGFLLLLLKLATAHWFPPVLLSLVLIVAYGFVLWDREWNEPRFEHAGDNLYYVGFLYTLVSLAVSLYRFTSDGYTEEIVQGFGVALSSTVFGLIGRVFVNQPSADEPGRLEASARSELVVAHRRLRAQMDHALEDYKRFREDLSELREAVERAKGATDQEREALENEAARLEELRAVGSRLEEAAEAALARIAERQEETAVVLREEATATLRDVASRQEAVSDATVRAQRRILEQLAARLDSAASSLDQSAGSMVRTIRSQEQGFGAEASALRAAVGRALESFRTADFEREVAVRVLDPAGARLAQLMDGFRPLVESLGSTQAGQERAIAECQRLLEQLSRISARHEDLAGSYVAAADSLSRASSTLDLLPDQLERQSRRSEAVMEVSALVIERLGELNAALDNASAALDAAASALASMRKRSFLRIFRVFRRN